EGEQVTRPGGQPVGRVMDELNQIVGPVGVQQVHQNPQSEDDGHDVRDHRDDRPRGVGTSAISRGHTFRLAPNGRLKPVTSGAGPDVQRWVSSSRHASGPRSWYSTAKTPGLRSSIWRSSGSGS